MEGLQNLQQGKITISHKKDQINTTAHMMKSLEKPSCINVAETSYSIEQDRSKIQDYEQKITRLSEAHQHDRINWERSMAELKEEIISKQAYSLTIQHDLQNQITNLKSEYQKQVQLSLQLQTQMNQLSTVFQFQKAIETLGKSTIWDLPSYLQLLRIYQERQTEQRQLSLQMERLKSETVGRMEESFRPLNSYEEMMEELRKRNQELQHSVEEKQSQLFVSSSELENRKVILQQVHTYTSDKINQLNDEISILRNQIKRYQIKDYSLIIFQRKQKDNLQRIEELEILIEEREKDSAQQAVKFEEQIFRLVEQKKSLQMQFDQFVRRTAEQTEYLQSVVYRHQKNLNGKEEIIELLNTSLRELEECLKQQKAETQRHLGDCRQLLKKKHKMEEQLKEKESIYSKNLSNLIQEIDFMRHELQKCHSNLNILHNDNGQSVRSEEDRNEIQVTQMLSSGGQSPRNLLSDFGEKVESQWEVVGDIVQEIGDYEGQPNWAQLYVRTLRKHNDFVKKAYLKVQSLKKRKRSR